ncbi:MFS general substrate transporter [Backusella circina FSU 941]|nr:MFS general substrate transporter [Backusella circina FSU 941]
MSTFRDCRVFVSNPSALLVISKTQSIHWYYRRGASYLSRLNLPDTLNSLVWLAGPLSGLIVQPIIGALSDKSTCRFGRRRPFIIVGAFLTSLFMLGVAFAKEIGGEADSSQVSDHTSFKSSTIVVAVLSFYLLDFSVNIVQVGCKMLIIDLHPINQQERANAFANIISNITNIIGYFVGSLDLVHLFPLFVKEGDQDAQLKIFCIIAIVVFIITVTISCVCVKEECYVPSEIEAKTANFGIIRYFWRAIVKLPRSVRILCCVSFVSSMAYYPSLFYASAWVEGINNRIILDQNHQESLTPQDFDSSERVGSLALLINSIAATVASLIIPWISSKKYISMKYIFSFSFVLLSIAYLSTWAIHNDIYGSFVVYALMGVAGSSGWYIFSMAGKYVEIERHKKGAFDTGILLGIVNVSVVLGQFVDAAITSAVFARFSGDQPTHQGVSVEGISWMFRISGFMFIVAFIISCFIEDDEKKKKKKKNRV